VSLKGAKVTIETDITNPNVFRLGLQKLDFEARVGDVVVGSLAASLPDGLPAKTASKLTLTGRITASRAVMQLVRGESLGTPAINYTGSIETPYGSVPLERP
jgi:hypothetical protein